MDTSFEVGPLLKFRGIVYRAARACMHEGHQIDPLPRDEFTGACMYHNFLLFSCHQCLVTLSREQRTRTSLYIRPGSSSLNVVTSIYNHE
jgi:hypothetical protein